MSKQKMYDIGSELGMEVISEYELIDIDLLKFNKEYQRAIEPARLRRIANSIKATGYWPQEVITVNQRKEIIDGQHRVLGAQDSNIKKIPMSVVKFPSSEKEAEFFWRKNNWSTNLRPIDFWYARLLARDSYAVLLDDLTKDPTSFLYDMVSLKGHERDKSKFLINNVLMMINSVALGDNHPWSKDKDPLFRERIKVVGYDGIKAKVNRFLDFFYRCFGKSKSDNPLPYASGNFRAFVVYYKVLEDAKELDSDRKFINAVNKTKQIIITSQFNKLDHSGKIMMFLSNFNKGKSAKNRVEWIME